MKKKLLLLTLLVIIAAAPAFSFGIGGAFGLNFNGFGTSGLLSVKFDEFPAVFGLGAHLSSSDVIRATVTADWWLYQTNLVEMLDLYVGPGLFLVLGSNVFDFGVRVPIGIHMFVIEPLELFLEIAPTIGVEIAPSFDFPTWGVQGAVGFRFWF